MTACAKALHLSQPAVSNLLKDLETAFGTTLVERDARGGRLTPAGARVLTQVIHSLAWLDAALQEAGLIDADHNHITDPRDQPGLCQVASAIQIALSGYVGRLQQGAVPVHSAAITTG